MTPGHAGRSRSRQVGWNPCQESLREPQLPVPLLPASRSVTLCPSAPSVLESLSLPPWEEWWPLPSPAFICS